MNKEGDLTDIGGWYGSRGRVLYDTLANSKVSGSKEGHLTLQWIEDSNRGRINVFIRWNG